jgi:molecular chaperone DnaJ
MAEPMPRDLYEILGVARNAPQDEIRRAYLKLAHKYHPDKTGGDKAAEEKLKEVNAAYDVLKNPEKRKAYDRFGTTDGQAGFGGGGFSGGGFGSDFEAPFEDFFDMLFGQGRRRSGAGAAAQPGNDLELRLAITLEEAAFGAKKTVNFPRRENCADCRGTGAAPGTEPETCPQCGGAGQVRGSHGFFSITRTCNRCGGAGRIVTRPCSACSGSGRIKQKRELSVDVPAGVDTGSRLRISGEGEPGRANGPRGDLYILMEVQPHAFFQRDGANIILELPVTLTEAALGTAITVPTLSGDAELKVPAGTQSGAVLRMRGQGMPDLRGYYQGDQLIHITVETPVKLSRKQKELLRELDEMIDSRNIPARKAFEKKVRNR